MENDGGVVHTDHRKQLLPILMRLLYGKFHSQETTHTSSKDTKSIKRTIIIQFLAACSENELNYFFNLIFQCLSVFCQFDNRAKQLDQFDAFETNEVNYESLNQEQIVSELLLKLNDVSSEATIYDLKSVIPLKKILGILQSLEIVIKKLAKQMENFAHRILKMLCFIHKYAFTIFELGSKLLSEYHLNLIKIIRQQVTLRFKEVKLMEHLFGFFFSACTSNWNL